MGDPSSLAAAVLALFLIFWTGSSWFVALHPRLFRRILRGAGRDRGSTATLRLTAVVCGCVGLAILMLPNL